MGTKPRAIILPPNYIPSLETQNFLSVMSLPKKASGFGFLEKGCHIGM
jgi:hypothetical protein